MSDVERSDALLAAAQDEVAIGNLYPKPEVEIGERLAKLKGQEYLPSSGATHPPVDPFQYLQPSNLDKDPLSEANDIDDISKVLNEMSVDAERAAAQALGSLGRSDKEVLKKANARSEGQHRRSKRRPDRRGSLGRGTIGRRVR